MLYILGKSFEGVKFWLISTDRENFGGTDSTCEYWPGKLCIICQIHQNPFPLNIFLRIVVHSSKFS